MKRGEIWTVSGGSAYTGKPRPAVILQDDPFDATSSVTVCVFTTNPTDAPLLRIPVNPSEQNGLREPCRLMIDKITTVPRSRVRARIGRLEDDHMTMLNRAIAVFLGLAGTRRRRSNIKELI
jgi:mRNA interferase MazF